MSPSFQFATRLEVQQELALRLNDVNNVRWTAPELQAYIAEALMVWQVLTQEYVTDWTTNYVQPNPATLPVWQSLGNGLNTLVGNNPTSPRYQTLTDSYVFQVAQWHLLEPPTGNGTWTGTSMFSLQDFVNSFASNRDEILQQTDCNVGPFSPMASITPGTNRIQIPDNILDMRRVRYLPVLGDPKTLYRDDLISFEYFTNQFQQDFGDPLCWDVLGSPQQFLTFDNKPNVPNTLDMLGIVTADANTPPTTTPLLIPDDFYWVLKFSMMADMLAKETESKDLLRSQYCEQRAQEGIQLMRQMPWMMQAYINQVPVDTPSFFEADQYSYEWESDTNAPSQIVRGGIDLFATCPLIPAGTTTGVTLSLVANAPIPTTDAGYVQVSRDVLNAILDESEHLAQWKEGGQEMADSMFLHKRFIDYALQTNKRLRMSGIFATDLRRPISKQDEAQPRFALEESNAKH